MNNKEFYKRLWFWLIVVGVLIFIANIIILYNVNGVMQSAWLTLISGWISGIATLFVGIIAYCQNKSFSYETAKNSLINKITTYMSDFQIGYINYVQIDKIIDLSYRIRECSLETRQRIKDSMRLDISDDMIFFERNLMKMEAILMKSDYSSSNIIALHKKLKEMEKKFDDFGFDYIDEQYDERYYYNECQKRSKYIQQWMKDIDHLSNAIMLDYHDLRTKLLENQNVKQIENELLLEKKNITDYFKNLSKEQLKEQNNG